MRRNPRGARNPEPEPYPRPEAPVKLDLDRREPAGSFDSGARRPILSTVDPEAIARLLTPPETKCLRPVERAFHGVARKARLSSCRGSAPPDHDPTACRAWDSPPQPEVMSRASGTFFQRDYSTPFHLRVSTLILRNVSKQRPSASRARAVIRATHPLRKRH